MDSLLNESLTKSDGRLSVLDVQPIKLDQDPGDADLLSNIFRLTRQIKGACGLLDLPRLEAVDHVGGSVSGKTPEGEFESSAKATGTRSAAAQNLER